MDSISLWIFIFIRCGAMLVVFPILSAPQFPVRSRITLAAGIAFVFHPVHPPVAVGDLALFSLVVVLLKEVAVGLMIGFTSRLVFFALEFFASLVGVEIGLNVAPTLNLASDSRSEVFGMLAFYLGAMLLFSLELHHWILAALQRSFEAVPIGAAAPNMPLYYGFTARVSQVFLTGLLMAAPVIAIAFLISVTFALISRAVPTMNVFAESFSFRVLGGLLVFGLTLNLTAQHVSNGLRRLPEEVLRIARAMNPV